MMHPLSMARFSYEVYMSIIIIIFVGFLLPVKLGWAEVTGGAAWVAVFTTGDALFFVDVLLNFRLGYILEDGSMLASANPAIAEFSSAAVEMDPRKVAVHYVRTWFLVDLAASIPFDLIYFESQPQSKADLVNLLRLLKVGVHCGMMMRGVAPLAVKACCVLATYVAHLPQVFRFTRVHHFLRIKGRFGVEAREYGVSLLWMFLYCHYMGCIFFLIGRKQPPSPDGAWVYSTSVMQDGDQLVTIIDANPWQQYVTALYYAFVAMASGLPSHVAVERAAPAMAICQKVALPAVHKRRFMAPLMATTANDRSLDGQPIHSMQDLGPWEVATYL
eukprot:jgi/Mesvir1/4367/Mv02446-RA.1